MIVRSALFMLVLGCGASHAARPDLHTARTRGASGSLVDDADQDGVVDAEAGCPEQQEDRDGFQDDDGCPDPDSDGDGIEDAGDACPDAAEDMDAFEDEDGCPDPDNDLDRYLDADDDCPNEPEVYNGYEDHDGCPDRRTSCILLARLVTFHSRVQFRDGSTRWDDRSGAVVEQLAAFLQTEGMPKVSIVVAVDDGGRGLAEARGRVLRDALREQGVADVTIRAAIGLRTAEELGAEVGGFDTIDPNRFHIATDCDGSPVEPMRIEPD